MIPVPTLSLGGRTRDLLKRHLFPGDGCEAAAILLCARTPGPRLRLIVREVLPVPHADCAIREPDLLTWPGIWIEAAVDKGELDGLCLILAHSHPGGLFAFSEADNQSDLKTIPSLFQAYGDLHGSAIMTPDGAIRARVYDSAMNLSDLSCVSVYGDDIAFYWSDAPRLTAAQRPLAFTGGMTSEIAKLSAAVIGVSGTGSIVAEQLARLGVGNLTLVDFDRIERKNLNRILNSTLKDAEDSRLKVEMFAEAISHYRSPDCVMTVPHTVASREAVLACSQADVIFSCVDTLEARHIADLMSAAFLLPVFDVGVVVPVRKAGASFALADVCGRIDYIQPEGASLQDRGVYSPAALRAEYLRNTSMEAYKRELEAGYIKGMAEEAPAVITLNMRAAAACVNEFLARAYPFRQDANELYARTLFSLAACEEEFVSEAEFACTDSWVYGRGNSEPLLGLPVLGKPKSERQP